MTAGLTEREINALGRHLPVLRTIAGEWPVGPTPIDERKKRLEDLRSWRRKLSSTTRRQEWRLDAYLATEIYRIEAELAKPPSPPGRPSSKPEVQRPVKVVSERTLRALDAYVNEDLTLEEIGERFLITRQRVQQLLARHDPTVYRLAGRRRQARERLRSFVKNGVPDIGGRCVICGEVFRHSGSRRIYCSPEHYKIWTLFRYHVDPDTRAMMRSSMAKRALRMGEDVQYAKNFLSGDVQHRGRWLQEGSANFEIALRAYGERWPLFDNLPIEIQDQIRDYVENGPKPKSKSKSHTHEVIPRDQLPCNVIRQRLLAGEELSGTVVAKELGTVPGVFSNLKRDMIAEGFKFIDRKDGKMMFSRLDPSCCANGKLADAPALLG